MNTEKRAPNNQKDRAAAERADAAAARQRARDRAGEEALPSKAGRTRASGK